MNATVPSTEENKRLAARPHEEIFNQGKLGVADEIFAPDFAWHEPHLPPLPPGPEGVKTFASMLRSAFPDCKLTLDATIAEDDRVAHYWSFRGTHQGEFNGIPGTGREVRVTGADFWRIRDGKLVENRQVVDNLGLLEQIGAVQTLDRA